MTNRLILGQTGQTLRHIPMGVASAVSVALEDLSYSTEDSANRDITIGSPVVASWSITTTAVAGPTQTNGQRISASSTTGATIGGHAMIQAPDGTREVFEILRVSSGAYIEAVSPLAGVYPSGSTVYGIGITVTVDDAFAADEDRYKLGRPLRVTWTYTLDGKKRHVPELVEWVRHEPADQYVAEAAIWVGKAYPDAWARLPDGADRDVIAKLMAAEVASDLVARGIDPGSFLTSDRGRGLLVGRIVAHLTDLGWSPGGSDPAAWADRAHRMYREKLLGLTIGEPGGATAISDPNTDTAHEQPSRKYLHIFKSH